MVTETITQATYDLIQHTYNGHMQRVDDSKKALEAINDGADVNQKGPDGDTALILALKNNMTKVATALIKHPDTDIHITNDRGMKAANYADSYVVGNEIVDLLQERKYASLKLVKAAGNYGEQSSKEDNEMLQKEFLKAYTNHGDVNGRDYTHPDHATVIMLTIENGMKEGFKAIIDDPKLDLHAKDTRDTTVVMYAARAARGTAEVAADSEYLETLLKKPGLDINAVRDDEHKHTAESIGGHKVAELLEKYSEKEAARIAAGETPDTNLQEKISVKNAGSEKTLADLKAIKTQGPAKE